MEVVWHDMDLRLVFVIFSTHRHSIKSLFEKSPFLLPRPEHPGME
jgi:hypothetical protein